MKKYLIFVFLAVFVLIGGYFFYKNDFFRKNLNNKVNQLKININQKSIKDRSNLEKEQNQNVSLNEKQAQEFFLEINSPKDKQTFNQSSITVSGKTTKNSEVFVNDQETKSDDQGNFSLTYNLDEGENILMIIANDDNGNYLEKQLTVYLDTLE